MGAGMCGCCGDSLLEKRQVQPEDDEQSAFGPDRRSSKVAPMSVLAAEDDRIDARLIKALNMEILPFVKQHCTGIYEAAFHNFSHLAKDCPVGAFCPKLPAALLKLLKAELATNIARAKKKRVAASAIRSFEASRNITHQRILKFFRHMLTDPYERHIHDGLLAEHAAVERTRLNRAKARGQELPPSDVVLAGLTKVLGPSLKLTQSLREVELTDTILRSAIRHLRTMYTPKPPKTLLDSLQRHLILCELLSTERAYVETLENLRIYRDKALEMVRLQRGSAPAQQAEQGSSSSGDASGSGANNGGDANGVFTKVHVDEMFREVEQLYLLNTTFLRDVEEAMAGWSLDGSSRIGKLLNDFSRPFRMYDNYCVGYTKMMKTAQALTIRSAVFRQLCASQQFLLHMSLADAMISPVQRVPRYCLLLRELLKYSPRDMPDRAAIAEALDAFRAAAKAVDVKIRDQANRDRIRQLSTLFSPPRNLVAPARVLHREVSVTVFRCQGTFDANQRQYAPGSHKQAAALLLGSKMKLFLFSDVLLIGRWRRKQGHFVYAGEMDVDRIAIEVGIDVPYADVAKYANVAEGNADGTSTGTQVSESVPNEKAPTTVQCMRIYGFSGCIWAVLNTAVSTRDIGESETDGNSNDLTFDPHRDSTADFNQLAKDVTSLSLKRRRQMIFKSISHLSVVPSVAPVPATRTNSLIPIDYSAAGVAASSGVENSDDNSNADTPKSSTNFVDMDALEDALDRTSGSSGSLNSSLRSVAGGLPLMRRETNADAFFSLHARASFTDAAAQKHSRRHFESVLTLDRSVIPAIREQEFAVAWQMAIQEIQIQLPVGSRLRGKSLHARVRLLGRLEDFSAAKPPTTPSGGVGGAAADQAAAAAATTDADQTDEDVAFVTYTLNEENTLTWTSLAVLYLGDIAAGDWGIDGPKLQIELFDDAAVQRRSFGASTPLKPEEVFTVFVKDLPSAMTQEVYSKTINQLDTIDEGAAESEQDDEIHAVVCDMNEWLSFSSTDARKDTSVPRIRLKMKLSTHIPSYDLVLLSH